MAKIKGVSSGTQMSEAPQRFFVDTNRKSKQVVIVPSVERSHNISPRSLSAAASPFLLFLHSEHFLKLAQFDFQLPHFQQWVGVQGAGTIKFLSSSSLASATVFGRAIW